MSVRKDKKALAHGRHARVGVVIGGLLEHIEFLRAADRCPTVIHLKLVINILGVGSQCVKRNHEFAGNIRTAQFSSEQPKHVTFAFAQWFDS